VLKAVLRAYITVDDTARAMPARTATPRRSFLQLTTFRTGPPNRGWLSVAAVGARISLCDQRPPRFAYMKEHNCRDRYRQFKQHKARIFSLRRLGAHLQRWSERLKIVPIPRSRSEAR